MKESTFNLRQGSRTLKCREGGGSTNGLGMCIFVQAMVGGP